MGPYDAKRQNRLVWLKVYPCSLLFDDNKIKMARPPGRKQKENPVGCTGEGKGWKGNIRERSREDKTGTVLELSLEVRCPCKIPDGRLSILNAGKLDK